MSKYSTINLIKRQAKALSKTGSQPLSVCQEEVAKSAGFSDFHELTTVAKRHPDDARLMLLAFGVDQFSEVPYLEPVYAALESELDDVMSGSMAETNAYDFIVEDLEASSSSYDETTGVLTQELTLQYVGDQHPDKPYSGTSFYIKAYGRWARRDNEWRPIEGDDWLDIVECERDDELDHRLHPEVEDL